ncbi:Uncharacterized conserved protein [Actinacidiphila yanglinensis]|uniref:Uncharacterized conserved protein n=1 Tax=Actinacidiphila yanglinensis TaxID=310779 RepID=A0A1H6CIS4_9ACTN|nr:YciI family protein [Actinacidiphila yanglinensis]SEG72874.1 Uncharacterized conserved protein [Actinacidiphila yanglinensis]
MAKYLFLIYGDERTWEAFSAQDRKELEAGHAAFVAAAGDAVLGTHELRPTATATTLRGSAGRTSAGKPTPTDGPFLESKEVLGGYYLIEAPDLDAAIALAGLLPEVSAAHSGVEIRPVVEPV